jgi:hypothetical protein
MKSLQFYVITFQIIHLKSVFPFSALTPFVEFCPPKLFSFHILDPADITSQADKLRRIFSCLSRILLFFFSKPININLQIDQISELVDIPFAILELL